MTRYRIAAMALVLTASVAAAGEYAELPSDWRNDIIAMCRERTKGEAANEHRCLAEQERAAIGLAVMDVGQGVPKNVGLAIMGECMSRWRPDIVRFAHCLEDRARAWQEKQPRPPS